MTANQTSCRYDCGLDHVFLEGAESGESIDRIKGLHRRLAERVVLRSGPLRGKEIYFLRTYLGLTPEELEDQIDFGKGLIQLLEQRDFSLTRDSDTKLRRLVFLHHEAHVPSFAALYALYASLPDDLVIRVRPDESDIGWTHTT